MSSFISVEPQSRVLLESHTNTLLAQFDTQLGIITYRYLAFFQERRYIETTYIDSLRKLYRKAKSVDASIDPRTEPSTTRTAWDKVRDNLGRDADARQEFVDILVNDVIKPLEILKEVKDKTRSRINRNLKISASIYADHAEKNISKLQQAYLKKNRSQHYAYSANVSQRLQEVPLPVADSNKRFGKRMSALFRGQRESQREPGPAPSEEVSDDVCREAVADLNKFRIFRAENLEEGYDLLEGLVFMPTVKDVLVKYTDSIIKACAKHDDIAKSAGTEVVNALGGTDTSDLKVSFRRALSFSTPPLTLYRNYRPSGYSHLIFGVPLVAHWVTEDKVPKVMRMCIDEVEKRGLDIDKIYSSDSINVTEVRKLRNRFESETSFSFTSTDDIHSIAALLKCYLYDLPEPLFLLTLQEYGRYTQQRVKYTKNKFSLLKSKIRELHPVHRAALEALLQHLLRVSSHSDKNGLSVKILSSQFCKYILGFDSVFEGGVYVKRPVMEDLIQNVHTLFGELPSHWQSPSAPSSNVAETTPTDNYSSLFFSSEFPESVEVQATGSTSRHHPGIIDGIPSSTQSSFSLPPDSPSESRLLPPLTTLLSPLLGLSSPKNVAEGVETTTPKQLIPEGKDTEAIRISPNDTPPDVVPLPATTSVSEWQLDQSQLPPHPEAPMRSQSPVVSESVVSSASRFPLSSATSLQTGMGS